MSELTQGKQRLVALTSFLNLYALVGIAFYGPPFFYDFLSKQFNWSREQVTSGNTFGKTLVLPLFGFAAGWIIDRFGLKRLMIVGILFGAISIIGLGQVNTLPLFYTCFIFNALGYVCAGPLPNQVLLTRWFKESRGKAMGFAYLGIGLGGAITVKMASWLTGRFGWQTALLYLGILMAIVALPLTLMTDDKAQEFGQKNTTPAVPLGEILRSPSFYLLAIGSLCSIGAVGATNQHLKLFLARDNGFSQDAAANVIALVLFTSNVGRILMGWLADRFPKKFVMILIYLLVAAGIPLLFFIQSPGAIYLFAIVFGIGMGGDYMIIPLMAAELFGVRVMGRVMGLIIVVDGLAEAWVPKLVGRLRDQNPTYAKGFALMIGLALFGALAVSLLPRKPKHADA
ncbi:MAG TPA: MFS transporter [Blastocatellia bacterium]|nr:MFS transporter [Blastocatellia bacterium]HMV82473.1 MFS transporter [Blastocatellia bacterium]HMX29131.1 MFS transporter [Blastocatellia bacterium]HMZ18460.1 MFS transporter [Blastocatellia bacterium]HNG33632.1 MFS transporter [Blastocatellia bacterium]